MMIIYLLCGFFLGWSLGANDASNVFGTAVGSKMIKFKKAAIISSIFVIAGCVLDGGGTTQTLNELGKITSLKDAAIVTFSSAFTVLMLTKMRLPVSTSQAIIGGIIGWNILYNYSIDTEVLTRIVSTWLICPLLAAITAIIIYIIARFILFKIPFNLLKRDFYIRQFLIIIGAFGSYSLGANNIANVIGVFVNTSELTDLVLFKEIIVPKEILLYFAGGLSIALGILTYSKGVMLTVGRNLLKLSPEHALIVVFSHSLVLFVFSSVIFSNFITSLGLPEIPLVPVSSTQAIIGAIFGLGLVKSFYSIKFKAIGYIALNWILTPVISLAICVFLLIIF